MARRPKEKYQDKILAAGDCTLAQALEIAKTTEYNDTDGKGQKLVAANAHNVNEIRYRKPKEKPEVSRVEGLA